MPGARRQGGAFLAGILANLDLVIFLSENACAIAQAVFPSLARSDRVWVEGLPISDRRSTRDNASSGGPLQVVVLGNFDHIKGGDALCKVFNSMREDEIEFHVHGHIREPYADILRALAVPNVHLHGAYQPSSLHQALARADIGLFLSLWPETYLLTLSEAWNAGVVPIVTDIGAHGERVAHRVNGLKVHVHEPASVVNLLRELIADRRELERLRKGIHRGLYRTTSDHVQLLTARYEKLLAAHRVRARGEEFFEESPARRSASAGNIFRMHATWLAWEGSGPAVPSDASKAVWKRCSPTCARTA